VRSFLLFVVLSVMSFGPLFPQQNGTPVTNEIWNDHQIRGYFGDLLRLGGFGHWNTERAAFLVRDPDGDYRCVLWPATREFNQERFTGTVPVDAVAIVHTHPATMPRGSTGDELLSRRLRLPIFILTPKNIYVVTPAGSNRVVVDGQMWAQQPFAGSACVF